MRAKLVKKLGIDLKMYNDVRSEKYSDWCFKVATEHGINHRYLVKEDVLFEWFLFQFSNLVELPFLNDIKDYEAIESPEHFQDLFQLKINNVLPYYPAALLKKIKLELKFKNNMQHG